MGRIQDKPLDGSVTGAEKLLASDADNTTVNILISGLAEYIRTVVQSQYELFSATNGQVSFVLNSSPSNVDVIVDRVIQIPGTDYNFTGNTVTMTYGQDLGSVVQIRKY